MDFIGVFCERDAEVAARNVGAFNEPRHRHQETKGSPQIRRCNSLQSPRDLNYSPSRDPHELGLLILLIDEIGKWFSGLLLCSALRNEWLPDGQPGFKFSIHVFLPFLQ